MPAGGSTWMRRERRAATSLGDRRTSPIGVRRSIKRRQVPLLLVDSRSLPCVAIEAASANPSERTGPEPGVREH
jgi:hypothetical protein